MLDPKETISGFTGAFCCVYAGLPFEVVKVRMQTQGNLYHGVFHALKRIVTEEGVISLWKGAVPALSSSIIENAVLFSVNGIVRRTFVAYHSTKLKSDGLSTLDEALIGGISGIFSATVCVYIM
jgi:solute carrier family 25 ornithine transporter 2/15